MRGALPLEITDTSAINQDPHSGRDLYSVIESITDLTWNHHSTVVRQHLSRPQAEYLARELFLTRPETEAGFGGPVYIVRPE